MIKLVPTGVNEKVIIKTKFSVNLKEGVHNRKFLKGLTGFTIGVNPDTSRTKPPDRGMFPSLVPDRPLVRHLLLRDLGREKWMIGSTHSNVLTKGGKS